MEQITIETLRGYSKKELRDYYSDLLKNVKEDENGNVTNIEYYDDSADVQEWVKEERPYFVLGNEFYRLTHERELTRKEKIEFAIKNSDRIIIKNTQTGVVYTYLEILRSKYAVFVYCFKEDYNCEIPDLTIWNEFKTMGKL